MTKLLSTVLASLRSAASIAWFCLIQLIMRFFALMGLAILALPCLLQFWEISTAPSIKDGRPIDRWKWNWLNFVWGNPEDGVSAQQALVRGDKPYLPGASSFWRAYSWSALRNSCDNLKYIFAWANGPLIVTKYLKAGWQPENGLNVPVFSIGVQK